MLEQGPWFGLPVSVWTRPRNGPKLGHASTMLYEPEFKALLIMHLTVIYGYNLFEKQNAETRA